MKIETEAGIKFCKISKGFIAVKLLDGSRVKSKNIGDILNFLNQSYLTVYIGGSEFEIYTNEVLEYRGDHIPINTMEYAVFVRDYIRVHKMKYEIMDGVIKIGKSFRLRMDNGEKLKTKEPTKVLHFLGCKALYIKQLNGVLYPDRFAYLKNDSTVDFSISIDDLLWKQL